MDILPILLMHYANAMDSDSSSSSSDDDDDDFFDAYMDRVEDGLQHELAHEPEPYHAEPGRPRTLEEGMAKFTEDNFFHFTRFSKEQ
eukprot:evm.model.NODE_24202_length_12110_cov_30.267382.1